MTSIAGLSGGAGRWSTSIWHWLLTIEHASLADLHEVIDGVDIDGALRVVDWRWNVVSREKTFVPGGFRFVPPGQGERASRTGTVEIDNIDERITAMLETLVGRPTVTIERVLAHLPDVVERQYANFELASAQWDARTASAPLSRRAHGGRACTLGCTPALFPGAFQ